MIIGKTNIEFSAAHILNNHPKCQRLHGHNYKLEVEIIGNALEDSQGMIMDFSKLKKIIKEVTDILDHRFLIPKNNRQVDIKQFSVTIKRDGIRDLYITTLDPNEIAILDIEHTTVEQVAHWIWFQMNKKLPRTVRLGLVKLWETSDSYAQVEEKY